MEQEELAATVRVDGAFDIWTIPQRCQTLVSRLQEEVGGYIEVVPLKDSMALVLNADAKLSNVPANLIATAIAHDSEAISSGDYVAGAVVLIPIRHL